MRRRHRRTPTHSFRHVTALQQPVVPRMSPPALWTRAACWLRNHHHYGTTIPTLTPLHPTHLVRVAAQHRGQQRQQEGLHRAASLVRQRRKRSQACLTLHWEGVLTDRPLHRSQQACGTGECRERGLVRLGDRSQTARGWFGWAHDAASPTPRASAASRPATVAWRGVGEEWHGEREGSRRNSSGESEAGSKGPTDGVGCAGAAMPSSHSEHPTAQSIPQHLVAPYY